MKPTNSPRARRILSLVIVLLSLQAGSPAFASSFLLLKELQKIEAKKARENGISLKAHQQRVRNFDKVVGTRILGVRFGGLFKRGSTGGTIRRLIAAQPAFDPLVAGRATLPGDGMYVVAAWDRGTRLVVTKDGFRFATHSPGYGWSYRELKVGVLESFGITTYKQAEGLLETLAADIASGKAEYVHAPTLHSLPE
jgi:hypothetical protein